MLITIGQSADAIDHHVLNRTLNADRLNTLLFPAAKDTIDPSPQCDTFADRAADITASDGGAPAAASPKILSIRTNASFQLEAPDRLEASSTPARLCILGNLR